jgi:hypothetical protein
MEVMMKLRSFVLTMLFLVLVLLFCNGSEPWTHALTTPDGAQFTCSSVTEISRSECEALVALYNSTSGPEWTNRQGWLQTNTPCSWYGINCQMIFGNLTHVMLPGNNLKGSIPAELGNLSVSWLDLSDNHLTGEIPTSLAAANIMQLVLDNNQLTGTIPAEIGANKGISALDVSHNNLSGNLPDALGQMAGLGVLNVSHNSFYGSLPLNLKNLNLAFLSFEETGLCEPDDADFQAWLASIRTLRSTGRKCGNRASWTLMYYLAEDNDLTGKKHLQHQMVELNKARSNPNINITIFVDTETDSAYYHFLADASSARVDLGEKSSGNPGTLREFVQWSQADFPAENYALIIYDHGNGVSGAAVDYHPANDANRECDYGGQRACLTMHDFRTALLTVPDLDIIFMEACLMGTIEMAWELRDITDFYVASENIGWGPYADNMYINGDEGEVKGEMVNVPAITSQTTPQELAGAMADSYYLHRAQAPGTPGTVSVMDLSEVNNLKTKTSTLASLLKGRMGELHKIIKGIKSEVQYFDSKYDGKLNEKDELVDLYHFAELVEARVEISEIKQAATELKSAINGFVVGEHTYHWSGTATIKGNYHEYYLEDSHGVSIFFPNYSRSFYKESWLDFAAGTVWDLPVSGNMENRAGDLTAEVIEWGPMLVEYVRESNPGHADDPNPPPLQSLLDNLTFTYLPIIQK